MSAAAGLLRYAAPVVGRLLPGRHGTILCFHGIESSPPANATSPHVSTAHFRETLEAARAVGEPVPLSELIERHVAGRSTRGMFAVTFDDAYASLATTEAQDVIGGLHAAITIFVATGASATGERFWWDRVESLHERASASVWAEFERAIGVPDSYRTPASAEFGPLRPLRQWVLHQHAGRWPQAAGEHLAALEEVVGHRTAQRAMTFDELDALVRRGGVEIGVHTISHPVLPLLGDDEARVEMCVSYAHLRDRWPTTLPWVAVPFGLYDDRTANIARAGGLSGILNVHPHSLAHAATVHGLPRVNIMQGAAPWKIGVRFSALADVVAGPPSGRVGFPALPGPD